MCPDACTWKIYTSVGRHRIYKETLNLAFMPTEMPVHRINAHKHTVRVISETGATPGAGTI